MSSPSYQTPAFDVESNTTPAKRNGVIALFSDQILIMFYFSVVIVSLVWDKSHQLIDGVSLSVRGCYSGVRSMIDSILEFSKNVRHYLDLLRKVFQYRMYKNVN